MSLTVKNNSDWPLAFTTLSRLDGTGLVLEPGETAEINDPFPNAEPNPHLDIVKGVWPAYTPDVQAEHDAAQAGTAPQGPATIVANPDPVTDDGEHDTTE